MALDSSPVDLHTLTLEHLALFAGLAFSRQTLDQLHEQGFTGLRFQHGFLFQHVLREPPTISALARLLEISQQAASKRVHALVQLGYLELRADEVDARGVRVHLSEQGRAAIDAGRQIRAQRRQTLRDQIGPERLEITRQVLTQIIEDLGGTNAIALRNVRLPS